MDATAVEGIKRFGRVWEHAAAIATATAAGLLSLSVFFDLNFVVALGLRFHEVPTTIADHIRSAVIWLPNVAVVVAIAFFLDLFTSRIGLEPDSVSFRLRTREGIRTIAFLAIVGVLTVYNAVAMTVAYWYPLATFGWLVLSLSILTHKARLGLRYSMHVNGLFVLLPVLVLFVGWGGYLYSERILSRSIPHWEITVQDGEVRQRIELLGLRRFQEVLVVVDMQRRVRVLPAASVVDARLIAPLPPPQPLLCRVLGWRCPQ